MSKSHAHAVLVAAALMTAVAFPAALPAHGQVLRGRVVFEGADAPIDSVSIVILRGTTLVYSFETDSLGQFEVELPEPGVYMLIATRSGYADVPATRFNAPAGRMLDVVVRMARHAVVLDPLEVRARRQARNSLQGAIERIEQNRHFGIGVHMTRDEIEKSGRTDVMDLIQSMTPSVRVVQPRGAMAANGRGGYSPTDLVPPDPTLAIMRFGELCPLKVYLDGMDVSGGGIMNVIHPDEIGAVEVYTGPYARDGYFDAAGCGIALIWSRRENTAGSYRRTTLGTAVLVGLVGIFLLAW